jgi:serine/threonine protein kinase
MHGGDLDRRLRSLAPTSLLSDKEPGSKPAAVTVGLPEDDARFYMAEVVVALRHMHQRGIIHRDIKVRFPVLLCAIVNVPCPPL